MVVAIVTIVIGALGAAAGAQELITQGILKNQLVPLTGGTLGAVSGALLVAAGISLLRDSPGADALTRAAAIASLPVTCLIGQLGWGLAGWPMTLVGIGWPVALLVDIRNRSRTARAT